MRLHFANMTRPRLVAKALHKALKRHGETRPLAECHELTARMFGYASWHELGRSYGSGPVSVDDAVAPSEAGYRRQSYVRTLIEAGLDRDKADAIVEAVRPSDRSRPPFTPPDGFPRLLVEAFEDGEDGRPIRSLGRQDLTAAVIGRMLPYRGGPLRPYPSDPSVQMLAEGLDHAARNVGYRGRLALPGLSGAIGAFVERVGAGRVQAFKDRLDRIHAAERAVENAAVELERVRHAAFSDDPSRSDAYVLRDGDFVFERDDGWYWDWEWDAYLKQHPRPPFDAPEAADWEAARQAFVTAHAPPYVYATTPLVWRGVSASDIRSGVAEDGEEFDVDGLIENELTEHHEDASEQVVDLAGLYGIAETWRKTPKSRRRFAALEKKVEAWNARQSIISYFQDCGLIMPAFPGKTKSDAVAWCEKDLAARIAALGALHDWPDQAPAEAPEEHDAFRP